MDAGVVLSSFGVTKFLQGVELDESDVVGLEVFLFIYLFIYLF